ncbi:pectin lyase fold/virulence factor [Scenedesmus sp. NREL 46B-D3]|nr:pectin lyase fold/virulence factor [Scenedesmus sp. NREL 46B-D3]
MFEWRMHATRQKTDDISDVHFAAAVPLDIWGCQGELWNCSGALSDWSFAGYGAGLLQIPNAPVTVDVKRDFQAAGDGTADDTTAVLAALKATQQAGGVIYFPPGRYLLSNQLNLTSNQVLRGAGRDATNLFFNTSLQQLHGWGPKYIPGMGKSPYTWAGALISTQRDSNLYSGWRMRLAEVAEPAARGDTRLFVKNLSSGATMADELFVPGQWMALRLQENQQADLAKSLCNNRTEVGSTLGRDFGGAAVVTHSTRVLAAGADWVEMERPLHVDITLKFKPQISTSQNFKVTGVGVEDLTIEFPWTPYLGHHEEPGYNAIEFEGATNSWVRRVRILNADAAIKVYASIFNTISDVHIGTSTKTRKGGRWHGRAKVMQLADQDGHIGVALHWASHDNLIEKFNITGTYHHDLLVAGYSAHNVFANGSGTDLCLDHHGGAPHNNLWTDIDLGLGQAALRWSGAPGHFPFAGSNNTFWNIWASNIPIKPNYVALLADSASDKRMNAQQLRRRAMLPMMNRPAQLQGYGQLMVDVPVDEHYPTINEAGDWRIYYNPDQRVFPANLYQAMQDTQRQRLQLYQHEPTGSTPITRPSSSPQLADAGRSGAAGIRHQAPAQPARARQAPPEIAALPALEQVLRDLSKQVIGASTTLANRSSSSSRSSRSSSAWRNGDKAPSAGIMPSSASAPSSSTCESSPGPGMAAGCQQQSHGARQRTSTVVGSGIEQLAASLTNVTESVAAAAAAATAATSLLAHGARQAVAALAVW